MNSEWTRGERLALYALLVTIIGVIVTVFIPELREKLGLNHERVLITQSIPPANTNVSPSPPVERDRGQPQNQNSEQSRLEATAPEQNRQETEVPRRYKPTTEPTPQPISIARTATVFDPPSNVRESPNGAIQCSVTKRVTIKILGSASVYHNNGWYYTDVCGKRGVIHSSQVGGILDSPQQSRPSRQTQINSENQDSYRMASVFDPPSNVRDKPNGDIQCSVTNRTAIRILGSTGGQGNHGVWYYTDICGRVGVIHSTQIRF
jgi:hypothetical protein